MSKFKRYDDEFKKSLVDLHIAGKTQSDLCRDYGVSGSALSKWVKQFSEVKLEDNFISFNSIRLIFLTLSLFENRIYFIF